MAEHAESKEADVTPQTKRLILILLGCVYFLCSAAYAVLAPFFPTVAQQKNIDEAQIGLIFGIYPVFKFIFSPICGIALPRIGVIYSLWVGMMLEGGCNLLFGFVKQIEDRGAFLSLCYILRAIQGTGAAFYQTAVFAYISSIYSDSVSTSLGFLEIFTSLGFLAGPPIGGLLYKAGSFMLPFIVLSSLLLVSSFIIVYLIPRVACTSSRASVKLMGRILCIPRIFILCIGLTLGITIISYFDPTFAIHIKPFKLTIPQVGLVFLIFPATFAIMAPVIGYLADKTTPRPYVVIGCIALAIALQFLGPAPYLHLPLTLAQTILSLVAVGISLSVFFVPTFSDIMAAAVNSDLSHDKEDFAIYAVTSGLTNAFIAAGQILGPILASVFTSKAAITFDWTLSILGFVVFGQALLVLLVTFWESYRNRSTTSVTEQSNSSKATETSPLVT